MAGRLTLVGTPIGNLGDLSPRAVEALREADFIAAEDTRVSLKLLNHCGIKKPMVSYYEHNRRESGPQILSRLLAGESCALVTDAGMPAISDPGEDLVRLCAEAGVPVTAIPGPCAAPTALCLSALPTGRWCFEGFLPMENKPRRERLAELREEKRTMVFYEAPHRLRRTLGELAESFGAARPVSLCRELTKLHEEVQRTTLGEAAAHYAQQEPRGEYVLVVAGLPEESLPRLSLEEAIEEVRRRREAGAPLKEAARQVAKETGHPKGALYDGALAGL